MSDEDSGVIYDVFVSYASQDAALAAALVEGLERDGLKCWIAPRDVSPGALYADGIIRAINASRLMVLVLSQHAVTSPHVGKEIERASAKRRPIIAIRTDQTPLTPTLEYFLSESQWIDVSASGADAVAGKLSDAVRRLLAQPVALKPATDVAQSAAAALIQVRANQRVNRPVLALIGIVAIALAYVAIDKLMLGKHADTGKAEEAPATPLPPPVPAAKAGIAPGFAPPPHSIAVLPFVNMSGDPKQDYFSDGLSEELLNSLTTIPDLHVAARTSSFFFKGKEVDLSDVAHKLNVGAVLEGSVRKDGAQVRITAQLIDAVSGFHLWSHTYDRDLKDILKLQTEIATAVTKALQATLMANAAESIELGGTRNPQALDAYLRGRNVGQEKTDRSSVLARIAATDEAIRLDPSFAKAYVSKALSESGFAEYYGVGPETREHFQKSRAAAERSLQLAPDLGEAHSALATVLAYGFLDFKAAVVETERALVLSPNDSGVLLRAGWFLTDMGRAEAGTAMARRGVALDQISARAYRSLAITLTDGRQYHAAIEAADRSLTLNPSDTRQNSIRGLAQLLLGDAEAASRDCDTPPLEWESQLCLAIAYDKLHRRADAEKQLAAMKAELGDASTYQYAEILAQWGDIPKALDSLETAYRLRDPGLTALKVDEFLDPLRKQPRFRDIELKLNFPN